MAQIGISLQNGNEDQLKFVDYYNLEKRLRSGSYGTVYTTTHKASGAEYAVKVIDRTKIKKKSDDDAVFREVNVLKELINVEGIVALIDFYVDPSTFHIVQVFAEGGDVFDRLAHRTTYSEKDARDLSKRLLSTLAEMHKRGYVHRDLKPENLLLRDEMDDGNIMLADFGFAKKIPEEGLKTRCGTPAFVAPEILIGEPYFEQADVWSCGVVLFLLLGGYPPFQDPNHRGLFRKVRAADYVFHETYWEHVSVEAKQLISSLLVVNVKHRVTAPEAVESSTWLNMPAEALKIRDLTPSLREMRKFNGKRKLKGAMDAVRWVSGASFFKAEKCTFSQQMVSTHHDNSFLNGGAKKENNHLESFIRVPKISFRDVYELKNKLRKGSFATVWQCVHNETQDVYAVKIIKREGLKPSDDEAVMNEVAIMQSLVHKHIVQLVDFYEEKDYFFLVMDLMNGGDVFDRIVQKNHYTENDARHLCKVLLQAVKYMHDKGVAHRDLKPQNLLLTSKDDDADIKVADFGFARRVHTPQSLTTRCGTPTYVAPEILKNIPHDCSADMWSVGVIIYVLLVGYPPFMEDKQQELFRKIRSGDYEFYEEDWSNISERAIQLIKDLLVVDPTHRLKVDEALANPWFDEEGNNLSATNLAESLRVLKKRRARLRSVATAVMWMSHDSHKDPVPNPHGTRSHKFGSSLSSTVPEHEAMEIG